MKKKFCFIVSAEITVKAFLLDHIAKILERHEVYLIANTKDPASLKDMAGDISVVPMGIERKINIIHDLSTLYSLYLHFRRNRYDIIHSLTPKAGLLSMVSAKAAGIPIRVHTFTGQVWANKSGISRSILRVLDRFLAFCATDVLVDSFSQRDFIVKENVVPAKKARVIANGSICGVDERRFKPDMAARSEIRKGHSIPESDIVFLFLGRLTVDKGILDLAKAFSMVNKKYLNTRLMIVGPDEEGMKQRVTEICKNCSEHLHFEGYTDVPERYMAASDVFCLPSYREGFGLVVIESAAVGIPSIGSRIYGVTDAIEDGVTGFFSEPAASHDLMLKMARFVENPGLIKTMGEKARVNALERYSREKVTSAMVDYYNELEGSR